MSSTFNKKPLKVRAPTTRNNKNEEHPKEHSSFLVRFVQAYSVIKIIAKAIINNHFICFLVGKYISIESKIAKNKDLYYDALSECQVGWYENAEDNSKFIKYTLGTILSAYRDLDERLALIDKKLTPAEMVEKAVESKIGKFTKSDIMELCPSISKASVENALKALVENGTIARYGGGRSTFYSRN